MLCQRMLFLKCDLEAMLLPIGEPRFRALDWLLIRGAAEDHD